MIVKNFLIPANGSLNERISEGFNSMRVLYISPAVGAAVAPGFVQLRTDRDSPVDLFGGYNASSYTPKKELFFTSSASAIVLVSIAFGRDGEHIEGLIDGGNVFVTGATSTGGGTSGDLNDLTGYSSVFNILVVGYELSVDTAGSYGVNLYDAGATTLYAFGYGFYPANGGLINMLPSSRYFFVPKGTPALKFKYVKPAGGQIQAAIYWKAL